jgi:hypothetical protein
MKTKIYILQEHTLAGWELFKHDKAVWNDLNVLHAFIANLLNVEYPDIRPYEDGVWKAYGRHNIQYKIIEASVN